MRIREMIKRRLLAWHFGISLLWIGTWSALAYQAIPPDLKDGLGSIPPAFMPMLVIGMPGVIGLALTAIGEGKAGVRALLSRFGFWRADWRWYAAALIIPPSLAAITLLVQAWLGGPGFAPAWGALPGAVAFGLLSGIFEETGWRGVALPRLLKRHSPLRSALLLGLVWGAWHLSLNLMGNRQHGELMVPMAIITGPLYLIGCSVLMTWVYRHVRGSMLLMFLFHFSITVWALVFTLTAPTTPDAFRSDLVSCAVVWLAAAVVIAAGGLREAVPDQYVRLAAAQPGVRY